MVAAATQLRRKIPYTRAKERKLAPDVITYNAAINACAQSGEFLGRPIRQDVIEKMLGSLHCESSGDQNPPDDFGVAKVQSCVPSVRFFGWLDCD